MVILFNPNYLPIILAPETAMFAVWILTCEFGGGWTQFGPEYLPSGLSVCLPCKQALKDSLLAQHQPFPSLGAAVAGDQLMQ